MSTDVVCCIECMSTSGGRHPRVPPRFATAALPPPRARSGRADAVKRC